MNAIRSNYREPNGHGGQYTAHTPSGLAARACWTPDPYVRCHCLPSRHSPRRRQKRKLTRARRAMWWLERWPFPAAKRRSGGGSLTQRASAPCTAPSCSYPPPAAPARHGSSRSSPPSFAPCTTAGSRFPSTRGRSGPDVGRTPSSRPASTCNVAPSHCSWLRNSPTARIDAFKPSPFLKGPPPPPGVSGPTPFIRRPPPSICRSAWATARSRRRDRGKATWR